MIKNAIVWLIGILVVAIAFVLGVGVGSAIIYYVVNFAFDVFNVNYQLTFVQSIAAYLVLWIIGSFFKSSGNK